MRTLLSHKKELIFCSALLLSASLTGCGYDDGRLESLEEFQKDTCTNNLDCRVGNAIIGDCVNGRCLRFCDIDTAQNDCEINTACEGGLCRPIVPCPTLNFKDDSLSIEYKNKSCIQVLSAVPDISWSNLLTKDVVNDESYSRNSDSLEDFASQDYSLVVPHDALYSGMNFSVVTLAATVYLKLLMYSATLVAQCTRPEILVTDTSGQPILTDDGFYRYDALPGGYQAQYQYTPSNETISMETLISVCAGATNGMPLDMGKYIGLSMNDSNIATVFDKYIEMIQRKAVCSQAKLVLKMFDSVSNVVMKMGMAGGTDSATQEGAATILEWLNSDMKNQKILSNDPAIEYMGRVTPTGSVVDRFGVFGIYNCDVNTWKDNVRSNVNLRSSLGRTVFDVNANGDYMKAKDFRTYCNEYDAAETVVLDAASYEEEKNECDNNVNCYIDMTYDKTGQRVYYKYTYDPDKAANAAKGELTGGVFQSQLLTCIYMMTGVSNFPLLSAMANEKNEDLKFASCATNNNLVSAMVDVSKIPQELLVLLNGFDNNTKVTQQMIDKLSAFSDPEVIYENLTDPKYIWLTGYSYMPLRIIDNSIQYAKNDLIMEVNYTSVDNLFDKSTSSNQPLSGPVTISFVPEYYVEQEKQGDVIIPYSYIPREDIKPIYESSFVYQAKQKSASVAGLYKRSGENGKPCKNCTFYIHAETPENSEPMICGGISYITNKVNGYIVLNDDDLKYRVGTRTFDSKKKQSAQTEN